MRVATVTSATGEPLTLEEVKKHLRLETGDVEEDEYLDDLITVARQRAEYLTGRQLMPETHYYYVDNWDINGGDYIYIPDAPLRGIASSGVYYTDNDGDSTTFASTAWSVDTVSAPGRLVLNYNDSWPTDVLDDNNPIRIEFTCGYSSRSAIPRSIKQAMKIMVSDMYENRESYVMGQTVSDKLDTIRALLSPYRIWKWQV